MFGKPDYFARLSEKVCIELVWKVKKFEKSDCHTWMAKLGLLAKSNDVFIVVEPGMSQ